MTSQNDAQIADSRPLDIARKLSIPDHYPDEVLREADALLSQPGLDDPALTDLSALPFCTIDNDDSRDLDQAIHIERLEEGPIAFVVRYALADAAYYVRAPSALFDEALRRGSSYYLPDVNFPMLPRPLSEGLVSLNPDVDRRALVVQMDLNEEGHCVATRIERAKIRSVAKLSYRRVQEYYDGATELADQAFSPTLDDLKTVGLLRIKAARDRHVVQYQRAETRYWVEEYNAQISLLCNAEGARLLAQAEDPNVSAVFRAHPSPPPERLDELAALTASVALANKLDPKVWVWRQKRPLAAYLEGLPHDHRIARALHQQAVMTNVRSVFQDAPGAHYGVGVAAYARFSAPMREIVGIHTHKEALELLRLETPRDDAELREAVILAGNRSKQLQKRLDKEVKLLALDDVFNVDLLKERRRRPWRTGTVMGMVPSRVYVQLDASRMEIKVYDPGDRRFAPMVGDEVRVRVRKFDEKRRKWVFDLQKAG